MQANEVYRLMWRQEFALARELVASEPSALTSACIELEVGDWNAARAAARGIDEVPLRDVLAHLIERRAVGAGTWTESVIDAWHDAGKPAIETHCFGFANAYDRGSAAPDMDRTEQVIYARMVGTGFEESLVWARDPARLAGELCDIVIAKAFCEIGDECEALVGRIVELAPQNLWARFLAFTLRPKRTSARDDARELAEIAELPDTLSLVTPLVLERLLAIAAKSGSRSPEQLTALVWMKAIALPRMEIVELAVAHAEAFAAIGRRMLADRTLIGVAVGATLIRRAAKASQDTGLAEEAERVQADHAGAYHGMLALPVHTLPLPSLAREIAVGIATDEIGFWRGVLARGA